MVRDAERELKELAGGHLDAAAHEGDVPLLLVEAQEALIRSEATQRKLAEQQLAILDALPAHIALIDSDGVILSVNDAWRRFSQANVLKAESFGVGLNYLAVCDNAAGDCAEETASAADGIRSVLRGEVPQFSLEYPCHSPTERRWFRLMATPVDDGATRRAVIIYVNATERRLAEERLRESVRRSAEAERIAHLGTWELTLLNLEDSTDNPLTVSDEMLRIVGVKRQGEQMRTADLAGLLSPEDRAAFGAAVLTAIRERQPYSITHRLRRSDGTERVLKQVGRCFFDEATGRPLKLVGTAHDITDQVHADEALRRSEREQRLLALQLEGERARLAAAQRVAKVGSWETNLATFDVIWSDETHRIFETDAATFQVTHARFLERVHPDDRGAVDAAFFATKREPCSIEHRIVFPDGRSKLVEERWQTFFDDQGHAVRALGTCQDITERKRAELELHRSRDLLRIASKATRLGGWMLELADGTITISDELLAIHELPPDSAPTFKELIELYDPEEREVLRRHMEACERDGIPYDIELPKRTATGKIDLAPFGG